MTEKTGIVPSDYNEEDAALYYSEMYYKANKLMEEENPCKINAKGICIRERVRFEMFGTIKKNNCCGSPKKNNLSEEGTCKYLGEKGCSVKSLECSLWFCNFIRDWYKGTKFLQEVDKIALDAEKLDLLDSRKPKEYTLEKIRLKKDKEKIEKELKELKKKYE